jgi:hypothetical protein
MKTFVLAALTALLVSCTGPAPPRHRGPYDNTGNGPQETGLEGGGG